MNTNDTTSPNDAGHAAGADDGHGALVIVGAGAAASELAVQARQLGWPGPITLVGEEPVLPYHRPPLSKAWLAADGDLASLLIRPDTAYDRSNIEVLSGRRAVAIDRARHTLTLDDGRVLPWAKLALCTGGRPRPWRVDGLAEGDAPANLHTLRTLADAQRLREQLAQGQRLVVVGAGYVGLEVAAAARRRGVHVTVIEQQARVLARSASAVVSAFYERLHRDHGVDLRTGASVVGVERAGPGAATPIAALYLGDGSRLACDVAVVGIGMLPNADMAQAAGLAVEGAIVVDEHSRTSDPDIVAAGDCTVQDLGDGRRLRLESVPNALEQARAAASWVAGTPKPNRSVPWFWSDQYEAKLQMAGSTDGHDAMVCRGRVEEGGFIAFYLRAGEVVAAEAVNRPAEFLVAKRLVAARAVVDAGRLADDAVKLKDLLPAASPAASAA